jgi:hypothetical protein
MQIHADKDLYMQHRPAAYLSASCHTLAIAGYTLSLTDSFLARLLYILSLIDGFFAKLLYTLSIPYWLFINV